MEIAKIIIIFFLSTFIRKCLCQTKDHESTDVWWKDYMSKFDDAYTSVDKLLVDRWDIIRQQKKSSSLAHLNTLQQINESCDLNNMQAVNQGPAITCVIDQEQRFCEFGWIYNPLGTKRLTCTLKNTPYHGFCCTMY